MSISRKLLKGMGLTEEQQDTIIEEHTNTVNELKEERDSYKEQAAKAEQLENELAQAKQELADGQKDSYKVKYDAIKEDFENYKQEQVNKETHSAKEKAYRDLLKKIGISDKRAGAVMKVSDVDSVELDDSGAIKDADTLSNSLKEEWSDFIQTTDVHGANVSNPPGSDNSGETPMTKEEIMGITDRGKRLEEIAKHKELFKKEN